VEIGAATVRPVSLFYSYSHRDEEFRSALETHLSVLRRSRLVAEWHDRIIGAGGDWRGEIDRNLASADIVLLLVSRLPRLGLLLGRGNGKGAAAP
jgi:hypothetical protein